MKAIAMFGKKDFLRDRRGTIAVFLALIVPVIFGMAALAVDIGYVGSMHAQLRATAEATALAAATTLDDPAQAEARALEYAAKNMLPEDHGTVLQSADVVLGNWDADTRAFIAGGAPTNAVQITVRRTAANNNPVELFFASVIGVDTADVTATAIADDNLRVVN
ncbi:MAG: TadG family pilus assembly protein [Alphaproteobacteria bacterium]